MDKAEIEDRVKKVVVEQLGVEIEDITPESRFVEDLNTDSLDAIEMVMAFEDEFDIEIPDKEAEKIRTVKQVVETVEGYMSKV